MAPRWFSGSGQSAASNSSFPTPQRGHTQSSGSSRRGCRRHAVGGVADGRVVDVAAHVASPFLHWTPPGDDGSRDYSSPRARNARRPSRRLPASGSRAVPPSARGGAPTFRRKPGGREDQPRSNDPDANVGREGLPQTGGQGRKGQLREAVRQVPGPQFAAKASRGRGPPRLPPFRSSGSSASVSRNGPRRLTAKTASHAAEGTSPAGVRGKTAALWTSRSRRPNFRPSRSANRPNVDGRTGREERRSRRSAPQAPSPPRRRRGTSGRLVAGFARRGRSPRRSAGSHR